MAGGVDERVDVEAGAAAHEEDRDEEAVADRLDLAPELHVGEVLLRVDDPQQRAGDERAEDRLDPELGRKRDEQQREPGAMAIRTPSWADGVLERLERLRDPQRPARARSSGSRRDQRAKPDTSTGGWIDPEEARAQERQIGEDVPNSAIDDARDGDRLVHAAR